MIPFYITNICFFFKLPINQDLFLILENSSVNHIWATSWENLLLPYANNKAADQPAHPRSLISAFVFAAWIV